MEEGTTIVVVRDSLAEVTWSLTTRLTAGVLRVLVLDSPVLRSTMEHISSALRGYVPSP